jgi:hypothetical protein
MNSGTQRRESPSERAAGQGGAAVNATIGLDRNRAHRHTGAALATSLLWRRDGDWCSGGSGLTGVLLGVRLRAWVVPMDA